MRGVILIMLALAQLAHPTLAAAGGKRPWPDDRAMETAKARAEQAVKEDLERQRRGERGACQAGSKLDPFEVWRGVSGPKEADRFLRSQYRGLGSVEAMADWFRCQGFVVNFMPGPFSHVKGSHQRMTAGFILEEHGGKPLWRQWWPWPLFYAHNFQLYFDEAQKLIAIGIGYTTE